MAANPKVVPQVDVAVEKTTIPRVAQKSATLKKWLRELLCEIFEGYLEVLGWTPD
jgi:hypothetical protein